MHAIRRSFMRDPIAFAIVLSMGMRISGGEGEKPPKIRPAQPLTLADLKPGKVDLDGNGRCEKADDLTLEHMMKTSPHIIEEALAHARRLPNGDIDLSPYLLSDKFDGLKIYERRLAKKLQSEDLKAIEVTRWGASAFQPQDAQPRGVVNVDYGFDFFAKVVADGKPVEGAHVFGRPLKPDGPREKKGSFDRPLSLRFAKVPGNSGPDGIAHGEAGASFEVQRDLAEGPEKLRFAIGAYHPRLGSAYGIYTFESLAKTRARDFVLTLVRGRVIQGKVLDRSGLPIAGASVQFGGGIRMERRAKAEGPDVMRLAMSTEEDGSFVFAGLPLEIEPSRIKITYGGDDPSGWRPKLHRRVTAMVPIDWESEVGGIITVPDIVLSVDLKSPR